MVTSFRLSQYVYISIMFFVIIIAGVAVPGIEIVFGLIGATAGNFLALLLPAAFYLKLSRDKTREGKGNEVSSFVVGAAWISLVLGIFTGTISLIFMYRPSG